MIGQTVSHYRVVAKLGQGGMGVVYRAVDLTLERDVALKFLPPGSAVSREHRSRMINEARAAASLLHPGICPVYEVGEHDGQTFIVMGLLEGRPMDEVLAEGKRSLKEVLACMRQLGEALSAAHAKGIVHRDIKPANVMLTDGNRPVLMDFGLALVSGQTRLTVDGSTVGTPAYMAPEQVEGGEADERTDIWALAVILYEMLAGKAPFTGDYQAAVAYSILRDEPDPVCTAENELPQGLDGILAKALAKDPADRYQKVDDLVVDLTELEQDPDSLPAGRPQKKHVQKGSRTSWKSRTGMVLAVVAAVIVGMVIWNQLDRVSDGDRIDSIGVLPLENLSGDESQDFWAAGITEQLSATLGTIGSLRVISDRTMSQFADVDTSLTVIGEQVAAKGLVSGSIQVVDNIVQITVKLYDARKDFMIWSDTYRRSVTDILDVQSEIARDIAGTIEAAVSGLESQRLGASHQIDPEAYKATLIGWQQASRMDAPGFEEAIARFQHAINVDPTYADAYVGLSVSHLFRAMIGVVPPLEVEGLIRAASQQALRLDESSSMAHAQHGSILHFYEWDWEGAEEAYRHALALNPSNSEAEWRLAALLVVLGRGTEAAAAGLRSVELDPLNPFNHLNYGWTLMYAKQYEAARQVLESTIRIHPFMAAWAHNHLSVVEYGQGHLDRACDECDRALENLGGEPSPVIWGSCGRMFALGGRRELAMALLDSLQAQPGYESNDQYNPAMIYGGLGDLDMTFALLERCLDEKSLQAWGISIDIWPEEVSADPRYQDILRRMNLSVD